MCRVIWLPILGLTGLIALASSAQGQTPYMGFVYPAGGQRGTTVQVRFGGQRFTGVSGAVVTGSGVSAKLVKFYRKLSNQEIQLIKEQARDLRRKEAVKKGKDKGKIPDPKKQELVERIDNDVLAQVALQDRGAV